MRRLTRTELAVAMIQTMTARAQQKDVSEYTAARIYIDFFFEDLVNAIKAGMSRDEAIHLVSVFAEVRREIASDVLRKRLRHAGIAEADNTSAQPMHDRHAAPPSDQKPSPTPKPAQSPVSTPPAKPKPEIPKPAAPKPAVMPVTENADEKYAHLRREIISGKGFLGEEEKWMPPDEIEKEKERRAAIERSSILGSQPKKTE